MVESKTFFLGYLNIYPLCRIQSDKDPVGRIDTLRISINSESSFLQCFYIKNSDVEKKNFAKLRMCLGR